MKKICSVIVFCFLISSLNAKVWTVDNTGKVANFTNITLAVSAASDGDTLLLGGGGGAYADVNLTKKLIIIGTGYFLTENPNPIENKGQTSMSSITFSAGSDGSSIVGMTITYCTISTDNITVRRCYIGRYMNISSNNNLIKQNFFQAYSSYWCINVSGTNNIVRNNEFMGGGNEIACAAGNIIENNVIQGGVLSIVSSAFGNNILISGTVTFTNCNPYNNIGNDAQFGTTNGNQAYVSMASVFIVGGTTDGHYQLASSSPAKGAGLGGVDCGMFGGNDPYVLSGMPDIPVITAITVPSRANLTNGLNVQINIRSNK